MGKLDIAILAGEDSKRFLAELTKQIDRLEKLQGVAKAPAEPVIDEDDEEDEAPPVKKAKAKPAPQSFDDEDEDDCESLEPEDDEEDDPPAKKTKAKAPKFTLDDVNDAAKARAAGGKRAEVLAILKKKFKVQSVSDLKPEQYQACIEAMEIE